MDIAYLKSKGTLRNKGRADIIKVNSRTKEYFVANLIRKKDIEHLIMLGKTVRRKNRGRQRTMFVKNMAENMESTPCKLLHAAEDRTLWRTMTTNSIVGGILRENVIYWTKVY